MDINNAYEKIVGKLSEWLNTLVIMLPNIVVAVLLVIVFYITAKIFKKISYKILSKFSHHHEINSLISKVVFIGVASLGLFFALGVLKLDQAVVSLLAGVGIIGIALGFAFQDMGANFISGVAIAVEQPFKVNDIIESNNYFGSVKRISLRTTEILTLQGQVVMIPNKEVFQNPLVNYSITGTRRVDVKLGVSYGDDLPKAKRVALEAVKDIPNQVEGKVPELFFEEFADSSINFTLRVWINYHVNKDYKKAMDEIIIRIKAAFDANDILIPFPIRTLDFGIKGGEKISDVVVNIKGSANEAGL